jgi:hypothetical protein
MDGGHINRRVATGYIHANVHPTDTEITAWKSTLTTRARQEEWVMIDVLVEYDTVRHPHFQEILARIRDPTIRLDVLLVPTYADLGGNRRYWKTLRRYLTHLGVDVSPVIEVP